MRNILLTTWLLAVGASAAEEAPAKQLWQAHCTACHGDDGKGTRLGKSQKIDDLSDPKWHARHGDAAIERAIRNGKPGTQMRPFKDKLTAEQIGALVRFIRTLRTQ